MAGTVVADAAAVVVVAEAGIGFGRGHMRCLEIAGGALLGVIPVVDIRFPVAGNVVDSPVAAVVALKTLQDGKTVVDLQESHTQTFPTLVGVHMSTAAGGGLVGSHRPAIVEVAVVIALVIVSVLAADMSDLSPVLECGDRKIALWLNIHDGSGLRDGSLDYQNKVFETEVHLKVKFKLGKQDLQEVAYNTASTYLVDEEYRISEGRVGRWLQGSPVRR